MISFQSDFYTHIMYMPLTYDFMYAVNIRLAGEKSQIRSSAKLNVFSVAD